MNWTDYFINIAQAVKLKSKDIKTQIGVVIVGKDNEIVSTGYNSFPRGINDHVETRQDRPEKYYWMEHAERNAIYNAARIGVSTKGCTMYCTCDLSCADCARAIINAGITKVVFTYSNKEWPQIWKDSAERSQQMFLEAGVKIEYCDLVPITDIEEFMKQPIHRQFVPLQWVDVDPWDKLV
jgi:dCMP deaminase